MPGTPSGRLRAAKVFGVCLAALGAGPAAAQAPSPPPGWVLTRYSTEDGLPQNSVVDVLRTRDGFIWIATFGGLARFDGVSFTVYDLASDPALPGSRVLSLEETPDGTLWIGTEANGLISFRNGAFRTVVPGERTGGVQDLAVDARGRVWLSGYETAGYLTEEDQFVEVSNASEGNGFVSVMEPEGETMWMAFSTRLLQRRDLAGDVLSELQIDPSVNAVLRGMRLLGPGSIQLSTGRGLVTAGDEGWELTGPGLRDLFTDAEGQYWVMSSENVMLGGSTAPGPSRPDQAFWSTELGAGFRVAYADREGSIWIGTTGSGLLHLRRTAFDRLASELDVVDVVPASDDEVWAATCGGLYRVGSSDRPGLLEIRGVELTPRCFQRVARDGAGRVLAMARGQLYRLHDGRLDSIALPVANGAHGPFVDGAGAVWVHSGNRMWRWDEPGGWTALGPELVVDAAEGMYRHLAEGDVQWIGTARGLLRWSPHDFREFGPADGLAQGTVRALMRGPGGRLWVGHYGGGISVFETDGRVRTLSTAEGLPDNFVVGLALDDDGTFWISGNNGLAAAEWADVEDFLAGRTDGIRTALFGRRDGFREGNGQGVTRTADGRIWFSTIVGVTAVDPAGFQLASAGLSVSIQDVFVDGAAAKGAVSFPSSAQGLEIRYTAPVFSTPENVRFSYRLEGLDDGWTRVGDRRSAFFSRLPPGDYTFQVEGYAPATGAVSRASIPVTVLPLWYQHLWVLGLAALSIVGLSAGSVRWLLRQATARTNAAEAAARQLQREIDERSRLEEEREALAVQLLQSRKLEAVGRLTGGIAHDFNNLLTAMIGHLDLLSLEVGGDAEVHVRALHDSAQRAGSLTRGLLAFSRRSVLTPGAVDVRELLARLEPLIRAGLPPGTFLRWEVPADLSPVMADQGGLENSILNLCINSRDALPDGGQIRIGASEGYLVGPEATRRELDPGRYVLLTVSDTGVGMEPDVLERVLEPFFTTKEVGKGTGLGLSTAFGFAKQSGGHLEISSRKDFGTEVTMILPVATEAAAGARKLGVSGIKGRGRNVLLVEDDQAVQAITKEYLKQMGFRTLAASTVAEARRILAQPHLLDVVLSDIMLPGETGFVLARELVEERPDLPLILTSGGATLDDEALEREGLPERVALLPKPFSRDQLAQVLGSVLGSPVEVAGG